MADYVIRATAAEGQIRAFAATTRDLRNRPEYPITPARWQRLPGQAADGRCDDGM